MTTKALQCALGAALLFGAALAHADIVTDWNQTAIKTALENPPTGLTGLRNLAIVHLAIHDAVNGVKPKYQPYLVKTRAPQGSSLEAAALSAAYASLVALYPSQKTALEAAFDRDLAKLPDGQARTLGVAWGRQVAAEHLQSRDKDGVDAKVDYVASSDPNTWRPTFPAYAAPLQPQFGNVKPFFVRSALQFDAGPPQGPQTELFAREFDEVKRLGGKNSTERTADQTAVAIFWTAPSFVIFSSVARQLSEARKLDLHDNARLFALLNGATTDAYISGWAVKYKYPTARPITLVREADKLGNPALKADAAWEPLLITPAHPNFISGHSIFAGAAEKVLQGVFATDAIPTVAVTYPANGATRRYTRISEIAEENDNGRVWGGIHTRQTVGHGGADQGRKVGEFAVRNHLLGADAATAATP